MTMQDRFWPHKKIRLSIVKKNICVNSFHIFIIGEQPLLLSECMTTKRIELIQKWKFTHCLFTTMPMEGWVKCRSPQNTFGASGVNSGAAKSNTDEVNGERFLKQKKQKNLTLTFNLKTVIY